MAKHITSHAGCIEINAKRITPRRAIAEALSTDIANIEPYQYGRHDEIDRQLYSAGNGVYATLPLDRNIPDGWKIIGEVTNGVSVTVVIERQ